MPWTSDNERHDFEMDIQSQLEAPMPWIGMYAASASLICSLLMAIDVYRGFRSNKLWFPCKYFSPNATSLTLLAVAMKLPIDFSALLRAPTDRLAKISSLVFLSTCMSNFMTVLGIMDGNGILMNVTALAILVITVIANVCIHLIQLRAYSDIVELFVEEIVAIVFIFLVLIMLVSSALMVPPTKRYLQSKYEETYKMALQEEEVEGTGEFVRVDKLRALVGKYWVMAETSCPQFVMARSLTCTISGGMSLLVAIVLLEAQIRMLVKYKTFSLTCSKYKWSTNWILIVQSIGVALGTIAPTFRWITAIRFKWSSSKRGESIWGEFRVEAYWIQRLVEWKENSLPLQTQCHMWKKLVHISKGVVLDFFIFLQFVIVLSSKVVVILSVLVISPFFSFSDYLKHLKLRKQSDLVSSSSQTLEASEEPGINFSRYILLLEEEKTLPKGTLLDIYNEVEKMVEKGKIQQPNNFMKLLQKSQNFNGVRDFDSHDVLSLHSQEPPHCWSLPLVTLTSIAVAIPNIPSDNIHRLLISVAQGLKFVKLIEKTLNEKGVFDSFRSAADVVWVRVELYGKWQDKNLHEISLKGKTWKEILEELANKAEKDVVLFKAKVTDVVMNNPINWPGHVLAANSMYRISRTILLANDTGNEENRTNEEVFEELSVMIADIFAACLTNLARVITMKCHRNAVKKREKSVRKAAVLLGKSEVILQLIQQFQMPKIEPEKAAHIEGWRETMQKGKMDEEKEEEIVLELEEDLRRN